MPSQSPAPPKPAKVSIAYQATRQDFLLAASALLAFATTSVSFWLLLGVFFYLARGLTRFASRSKYLPPEIDPSDIPPRTFFILMDGDAYGPMNWYFRKRKNQYFTWSFFFVNLIFCPVTKTRDRHGFRRIQLHHEFAHCGRGELLLFLMVALAAFTMIRSSVVSATYLYSSDNLYYFQVVFITFACYLIWIASRIIGRREHIADYLAYNDLGDEYLRFLGTRVEDFDVSVSGQRPGRFRRWLAKLTTWHPSFAERVAFLETSNQPSRHEMVRLILTAALASVVAAQVTQTMLLPRGGALSGGNASYFLQPVGYVMHFVMMGWLSWLIARSRSGLGFRLWTILTFVYCFGPALAQHAFMKIEDIFFDNDVYHIWHFIHPWATSSIWFLGTLVIAFIPASQRISTRRFTQYSFAFYIVGFIQFVVMQGLHEDGHLYAFSAQDTAIMLSIAFAIALVAALILVVAWELTFRLIWWVLSKVWFLRRSAQ